MTSIGHRLVALRDVLQGLGVDGLLVPRSDEHLGEYVPANAERLAWLTGFTGSAGLAIVLADRAAVFTDGRYTTQLPQETDGALWEPRHITDAPPAAWLNEQKIPLRLGYDPMLISEDAIDRLAKDAPRVVLVPLTANPIDTIWTDRLPAPCGEVVPHPLEFAGRSAEEKRADIAGMLRDAAEDAVVLTDPASLCWLLNIRGADVPFAPLALGFLILAKDGTAELFMAPAKIGPAVASHLGPEVVLRPPSALPEALDALSGKRVRVDRSGSPIWFAQRLRAAGAEVVAGADPCAMPKARKNIAEQAGARAAQARDAVALCRFLHWLALNGAKGSETELSAAAALRGFRAELAEFRGESFPAISGAGEHGAIIHYRVSAASDRHLAPDEVYLTDSGAQYPDGTTDVTRTIWTGPAAPPATLRERFTRVLQGHIALATLVFPAGIAGAHIDAMARRALWAAGLDYDHGTGHGIGSYLSVHEGPVSISRASRDLAIAEGMILSDEPGYYLPGAYGIRLENLLLAKQADLAVALKPFLHFETLTLAPFDRTLIDIGLLTPAERDWLDLYHARVLAEVGAFLPPEVAGWLAEVCKPL
jgi:Xaa-Pro aminopeptidase